MAPRIGRFIAASFRISRLNSGRRSGATRGQRWTRSIRERVGWFRQVSGFCTTLTIIFIACKGAARKLSDIRTLGRPAGAPRRPSLPAVQGGDPLAVPDRGQRRNAGGPTPGAVGLRSRGTRPRRPGIVVDRRLSFAAAPGRDVGPSGTAANADIRGLPGGIRCCILRLLLDSAPQEGRSSVALEREIQGRLHCCPLLGRSSKGGRT